MLALVSYLVLVTTHLRLWRWFSSFVLVMRRMKPCEYGGAEVMDALGLSTPLL